MNKKVTIVILALVALMLFAAVAPALAESSTKVDVMLTIKNSGVKNTSPEKEWTTEGGIIHKQGIVRTVAYDITNKYVTLKISYPSRAITYIGQILAIVDVIDNTKTTTMISHYHKWTITFPVQSGLSQEGSFVGSNIWVADKGPPADVEGHATLQGTGAFEGQTLKIAMDLLLNLNTNWYGDLLEH